MIDQDQLAVSPKRLMRTLRERLCEFHLGLLEPFGPAGLRVVLRAPGGTDPVGSVIVSQADHDGVEWIHASIAFAREMPTYDNLVALKAAVFGPDRWAYQVFAVDSEHVSIHDFALHLWGRADGERALPDFTGGMGSI